MTIGNLVSLKAIVIGAVLEFVLSTFVGIGVIVAIGFSNNTIPQDSTMIRSAGISLSVPTQLLAILLASSVYLLAGFIVGRIAKRSEIVNASLVAGIFVFLALTRLGHDSLWFTVANLTALALCHIIGGWLAQKRRLSKA